MTDTCEKQLAGQGADSQEVPVEYPPQLPVTVTCDSQLAGYGAHCQEEIHAENPSQLPVMHTCDSQLAEQGADSQEEIPAVDSCPHCLLGPCITSESWRQAWWPSRPVLPSLANSQKRKELYRKFYSMLYNAGAWKDPRYLARKQEALKRDKGRQKKFMWHKRELMPNCILKVVLSWYPNPEGVPYMGHYWE